MNWGSFAEFWHMGGYGLYVWGSYGVTALCIAGELLWLARRRRTLAARLTQMLSLRKRDDRCP